MRYVAAYLLASLGGNASPSSSDIEKIIESVGIDAKADGIAKIIKELKGKDLNEILAEGEKKLASVPSGGGGGGSGGGAAPTAAASEAKEEKKEEKKPESEEESDDDMGFGLFD